MMMDLDCISFYDDGLKYIIYINIQMHTLFVYII